MRKVTVSEYDRRWPEMYAKEAEAVREVLLDLLLDIHHIGSTAVPGLSAKPIIDIMPVVKCIDAVDAYNDQMIELGYEPLGENGIAKRRFFRKGGDDRTHHIHIFEEGDVGVIRHLAFRDYLRAHPNERMAYGELKKKLAENHPYDIEAYIAGKNDLVKALEKQALEWYDSRKDRVKDND